VLSSRRTCEEMQFPKECLMLSELEQNVGNRSERCKRDEETKKLRSCSVVVRGLFLFEFLVFDE
jgi:predicted lipoprotein